MSFILSTLITVFALAATSVLFPTIPLSLLRLVLCGVGWFIEKRTRSRREFIISRVRVEEEDFQAKKGNGDASAKSSSSTSQTEDEDWEKVDSSAGIGNNGNGGGDKEKSGRGKAQGQGQGPKDENWDGIIGFFHPFCNAGGGGERVLWEALKATQQRWPKAICVVYTGDHEVNKAALLERVESRFNIQLHAPTISLLYLTTRRYVVPTMYPYMTLLGQSLGSLVVAYDAFNLLVPDIFIDTMGYAFTLAFCKMLFPSVPTGAYVHYPTISTDMLGSLDDESGQKGINAGTGKGLKGQIKRHYWQLFARLYSWVGGHVDVVMCNSSWTAAHIRTIWGPSRRNQTHPEPTVIFPPTAVAELESNIAINAETEATREPIILYIAQFRPEKNHPLLLRSFARLLNNINNSNNSNSNTSKPQQQQQQPRLVLIGSVRHSSPDETHIYNLRLLTHELRIRDQTTFLCDAPWPTIQSHLRTASIGTNAMWNEHFGICVVEYQAAGLISVVHDSGGPREDIVVDLGDGATGFRATSEDEFAAAFEAALALPWEEKVAMRERARRSARRFNEEEFSKKWLAQLARLMAC